MAVTLIDELNRFKKEFNRISMVPKLIDEIIIPYSQGLDDSEYEEKMLVIDKNMFILKCRCGFVYFSLASFKDAYEVYIKNLLSKKELSVTSNELKTDEFDVSKVNNMIFELID